MRDEFCQITLERRDSRGFAGEGRGSSRRRGREVRQDPAEVYAGSDFATRDRYRHGVKEAAKRCRLSELDVWLAFFLFDVLNQFVDVARQRGDDTTADRLAIQAQKLRACIEQNAWDGEWYRRAYFDDGTPLGSASNEECQIDSLPQSWSILSEAGDRQRSKTAMQAVDRRLVRRGDREIRLFDPPFDKSALNPGYIKGYVPGVRENGGQYTHAAVWTIMALAKMGDSRRAWELFSMINPIHHGSSAADLAVYKVEPYVVAADVYGVAPHTGRGGWTWYTGSAGWMYRLITESLLGLHLEVDALRFTPPHPAGVAVVQDPLPLPRNGLPHHAVQWRRHRRGPVHARRDDSDGVDLATGRRPARAQRRTPVRPRRAGHARARHDGSTMKMRAMVLKAPAMIATAPLEMREVEMPEPGDREIRVRVLACGLCRTDLHVIEGELSPHKQNIIPGHQVVGVVEALGPGAERFEVGDRVGIAWLRWTCGQCPYCRAGKENLCTFALFTGYDADGGYAEYAVVREDFAYAVPASLDPAVVAPLLCAGIIGYRALMRAEMRPGCRLGLYGFGSSASIAIQIGRHLGCRVYVMTRDPRHQELARQLGATWAGDAGQPPPEPLDSAVLFAPVGDLVLPALGSLDRGGTLAVAGIHLTDIPSLNYAQHLFQEKSLRSVTANTRADGRELLRLAAEIPLTPRVTRFPLDQANRALQMLKTDGINGSGVLDLGST